MRELPSLISWLSPGGCGRGFYSVLVLLLICFTPTLSISNCATFDELKNNVIVTSLLNLHEPSSNCERVSLRGLQQRAIIEKTVSEINSNLMNSETMRLSVNIADACSPQDQGLTAALKSLLTMNQTCVNAPLLLGFIGPESVSELVAVQQITLSLRKYHLLPFSMDQFSSYDEDSKDPASDTSSILHVGNSRSAIRSKIILAVLNQMKWKSVYAVISESNPTTTALLGHLLTEVDHLCVTGLSKIPKVFEKAVEQDRHFYDKLIREYRESNAEGLLILGDSASDVRPFLDILRDSSMPKTPDESNPSILLYLNKIGLKSWELPLNYTILTLIESSEIVGINPSDLLQQSSSSYQSNALIRKYYQQYEVDFKTDAFMDILDSSVLALQYAVKLYWNAAKYARNIKCRLGFLTVSAGGTICPEMYNSTPTEWKSFLYKATYLDVVAMRKVSLRMNVPVTVKMYLTDALVNTPKLVGRINDLGITELHANLAYTFHQVGGTHPKKCLSQAALGGSRILAEVPTGANDFAPGPDSSILANIMAYGRHLFRVDESVLDKTPYIHLAVICSLAFVIFVTCLSLVVRCVYRSFKVDSNEEREASLRRKHGGRNFSNVSA